MVIRAPDAHRSPFLPVPAVGPMRGMIAGWMLVAADTTDTTL